MRLVGGRLAGLALRFCVCIGPVFFSAVAFAAGDAEIVSVSGKGDRRDTAQGEWIAAAARDSVKAGGFVRTHAASQMAILFPDRTQVRLNQNSQMQIKTLADASEWNQSAVKLNAGRAWSQARPPTAPFGSGAPAARISVETPSATLSIRGTDWEVEVGPDGRTNLVVLAGEVEIANAQGALRVGAGEAASAEIGKAPARLLLTNPAERIQWVTAWEAQPRRWLPAPAPEIAAAIKAIESRDPAAASRALAQLPASLDADILRADMAVMLGDIAQAVSLLTPHARGGHGAPLAVALLARAHLARGDAGAAAKLLAEARRSHPSEAEIWLASAELALYAGDAAAARGALAAADELSPGNAEVLLGRGRLETERENVRAATDALARAIALRPGFARAEAELGTLATLTNDFAAAGDAFARALASAPDDFVALTGRGIMALKTGRPRAALEDFLRAGVIEPRFARAWFYSAVAFYQLGETGRAIEALDKAGELDPRDPVPHLVRGLIAADQLDLGGAADAARAAQERMPYLKSLNQVLNNQKGSANLGSTLAGFGMEEWARHYAARAYSPWWAGSHLFLADRYSDGFNKNSELFKGFMTDPTVFGASQRQSTLVPTPGHHGRADLIVEQGDWLQSALVGTANGLVMAPVPMAYSISGDLSDGQSRQSADRAHSATLTVGLGARPSHALGTFIFGTDTRLRGHLNNPDLPGDPLAIDDRRLDVGLNFKIDSDNQFWLKGGAGKQSALLSGMISTPAVVPLNRYRSDGEMRDLQFRHSFAPVEGLWLSWGHEEAQQDTSAVFDAEIFPAVNLSIAENTALRSRDTYFIVRMPLSERLHGELGAFHQQVRIHQDSEIRVNGGLVAPPGDASSTFSETNWRSGLRWSLGPQSALTAVNQTWLHPSSVGSLAPVDTLGVALNDRLSTNGGRYRRSRLQVDHEVAPVTFVQAFVDRETVRNLTSPSTALVPDLQLTELDRLRNRRDAFANAPELEVTPQFLEGQVQSHGFALNHRLTRDQTATARYRHSKAKQTGLRDGLAIPYMPRDYLRVASQWSLPERWLVGVSATWRGERFRDEANTEATRIHAGWVYGVTGYWETADKRWVLQGILDNLRTDRRRSDEQMTKMIVRATYLF